MIIPIVLNFLKGQALRRLIRGAIKSALRAYISQTDNKIDDTIYSIITKIQDGKSIDDEITFLVNTYATKLKFK